MRLVLKIDSANASQEHMKVFDVYEFDLDGYLADGFTVDISSGYMNKIVKGTPTEKKVASVKFEINSNAVLYRYLSTNLPKKPTAHGDILQSQISPYTPPVDPDEFYNPSAYYVMEHVSGDSAPSDWGSASNYFIQQTKQNISGHKYHTYRNIAPGTSYDPTQTGYYRDLYRSGILRLYTMIGYAFHVYRFGGDTGSYTGSAGILAIGGDGNSGNMIWDAYTSSSRSAVQVYRNNPVGTTTTSDPVQPYKTAATSSANNVKVLDCTDPSYGISNGVLTFIHFKYTDPESTHTVIDDEYIGIAMITFDSMSDDNTPTGMKVIAFTPNFWGDSIISGGGGGSWGRDSYTLGGDGSFNAPSDNRGDGSENDFVRVGGGGIYDIRNEVMNRYIGLSSGIRYYGLAVTPTHQDDKLNAIISWMFDTSHGFFTRFYQSQYNPISGILSLHLIPEDFYSAISSTNADIIISGYNFTHEMQQASPPFANPVTAPILNALGYAHIAKYDMENYFGAFPDYEPYTRCILHLPYVGQIEIATNAIAHGSIAVDYICDVMNGNLCVYIWCKDREGNCTYKYMATGNCAYSIPIYNLNQDFSSIGKIVNGALSFLGMAKNPISGAIGGITGVASGMFDLANMEQSTNVTGTIAGNAGALADNVVWLEVIRPEWVEPADYQALNGLPLQMSGTIYSLYDEQKVVDGYTEISKIELDNVDATDAEKAEIARLLSEGVWIRREAF